MDKRELGPIFRERLQILMQRAGVTRGLRESIGVDRSALTQLLSGQSIRLPRADTLRRIAERYSVSLDWLLGLSQDETLAAEIKPALEIAVAEGADNDTLLERWHKEAIGYKIRYVPAQIPDLLRTPAVIDYEYSGRAAPSPSWQLRNAEFRLDYSRRPETDMEVCMPRQRLELLAEGRGQWRGLARDARGAARLHGRPGGGALSAFRLFLYDQLRTYSIPYTVFGPQRAAIFVGEMYLVLNATEHIRSLTRHFDNLIRRAVVSANESAAFVRRLGVDWAFLADYTVEARAELTSSLVTTSLCDGAEGDQMGWRWLIRGAAVMFALSTPARPSRRNGSSAGPSSASAAPSAVRMSRSPASRS